MGQSRSREGSSSESSSAEQNGGPALVGRRQRAPGAAFRGRRHSDVSLASAPAPLHIVVAGNASSSEDFQDSEEETGNVSPRKDFLRPIRSFSRFRGGSQSPARRRLSLGFRSSRTEEEAPAQDDFVSRLAQERWQELRMARDGEMLQDAVHATVRELDSKRGFERLFDCVLSEIEDSAGEWALVAQTMRLASRVCREMSSDCSNKLKLRFMESSANMLKFCFDSWGSGGNYEQVEVLLATCEVLCTFCLPGDWPKLDLKADRIGNSENFEILAHRILPLLMHSLRVCEQKASLIHTLGACLYELWDPNITKWFCGHRDGLDLVLEAFHNGKEEEEIGLAAAGIAIICGEDGLQAFELATVVCICRQLSRQLLQYDWEDKDESYKVTVPPSCCGKDTAIEIRGRIDLKDRPRRDEDGVLACLEGYVSRLKTEQAQNDALMIVFEETQACTSGSLKRAVVTVVKRLCLNLDKFLLECPGFVLDVGVVPNLAVVKEFLDVLDRHSRFSILHLAACSEPSRLHFIALCSKMLLVKPPSLGDRKLGQVLEVLSEENANPTAKSWPVACCMMAVLDAALEANPTLEAGLSPAIKEKLIRRLCHYSLKGNLKRWGPALQKIFRRFLENLGVDYDLKMCIVIMRECIATHDLQPESSDQIHGAFFLEVMESLSSSSRLQLLWTDFDLSQELVQFIQYSQESHKLTTAREVLRVISCLSEANPSVMQHVRRNGRFEEYGALLANICNTADEFEFARQIFMKLATGWKVSKGDEKLLRNVDPIDGLLVLMFRAFEAKHENVVREGLKRLAWLVSGHAFLVAEEHAKFYLESHVSTAEEKSSDMEDNLPFNEQGVANATALLRLQQPLVLQLIRYLEYFEDEEMQNITASILCSVLSAYTSVRHIKTILRKIWEQSRNSDFVSILVRILNMICEGSRSRFYFEGKCGCLRVNFAAISPSSFPTVVPAGGDEAALPEIEWPSKMSLSFACWIKPFSIDSEKMIFELLDRSGKNRVSFSLDEGVPTVCMSIKGKQKRISASQAFQIGSWAHVSLVFRKEKNNNVFLGGGSLDVLELFVDSEIVARATQCPLPIANKRIGMWCIGGNATYKRCFHGNLSLIQFWCASLNLGDVNALYWGRSRNVIESASVLRLNEMATNDNEMIFADTSTSSRSLFKGMHAYAAKQNKFGVHVCLAKGAKKALQSVGHLHAVLPLLALETSGLVTGCSLFLTGKMIRNLHISKDILAQDIAVIAHLLSRLSTTCVKDLTLIGAISLVRKLEGESSLFKQALHQVLLNFKIWLKSGEDPDSASELLRSIPELTSNFKRLGKVLSMQEFVNFVFGRDATNFIEGDSVHFIGSPNLVPTTPLSAGSEPRESLSSTHSDYVGFRTSPQKCGEKVDEGNVLPNNLLSKIVERLSSDEELLNGQENDLIEENEIEEGDSTSQGHRFGGELVRQFLRDTWSSFNQQLSRTSFLDQFNEEGTGLIGGILFRQFEEIKTRNDLRPEIAACIRILVCAPLDHEHLIPSALKLLCRAARLDASSVFSSFEIEDRGPISIVHMQQSAGMNSDAEHSDAASVESRGSSAVSLSSGWEDGAPGVARNAFAEVTLCLLTSECFETVLETLELVRLLHSRRVMSVKSRSGLWNMARKCISEGVMGGSWPNDSLSDLFERGLSLATSGHGQDAFISYPRAMQVSLGGVLNAIPCGKPKVRCLHHLRDLLSIHAENRSSFVQLPHWQSYLLCQEKNECTCSEYRNEIFDILHVRDLVSTAELAEREAERHIYNNIGPVLLGTTVQEMNFGREAAGLFERTCEKLLEVDFDGRIQGLIVISLLCSSLREGSRLEDGFGGEKKWSQASTALLNLAQRFEVSPIHDASSVHLEAKGNTATCNCVLCNMREDLATQFAFIFASLQDTDLLMQLLKDETNASVVAAQVLASLQSFPKGKVQNRVEQILQHHRGGKSGEQERIQEDEEEKGDAVATIVIRKILRSRKLSQTSFETIVEDETSPFGWLERAAEVARLLMSQELAERRKLRFSKERLVKSAISRWTGILKQVANERGTWGEVDRDKVTYTKLDLSESSGSRLRFKVKPTKFPSLQQRIHSRSSPRGSTDSFSSERGDRLNLFHELQMARAIGGPVGVPFGSTANDSSTRPSRPPLATESSEEMISLASKSKALSVYSVTLVNVGDIVQGRLEVSQPGVKFLRSRSKTRADGSVGLGKRWTAGSIRRVHLRRYNMQWTAMELFTGTTERKSSLFNFDKVQDCVEAIKGIAKLIGQDDALLSPAERAQRSGAQSAWMNGRISNLEYLMILNDFAGRTYVDLAQYPILPWVIADYSSPTLDLRNEKTFRNLSYPIGALTTERREELRSKYDEARRDYEACIESQGGPKRTKSSNSLSPMGSLLKWPVVGSSQAKLAKEQRHGDENVLQGPPWHFGSHYSSRATVIWYMIRLEPFTGLHIDLQGGRFDHADRQFHSIAGAFEFAKTVSPRELIPEFFGNPEFLRNSSNLDLGLKQDGSELGDVILPPWASTAEEFIRLNREALESEHVDKWLHHWIDLTFGYKQQGREAENALNVYFHLMYEGSVDLAYLQSSRPDLHNTVIRMIEEYGQSPPVLFDGPHPRKRPKPRFRRSLALQSQESMHARFEDPKFRQKSFADDPVLWFSPLFEVSHKSSFPFPLSKSYTEFEHDHNDYEVVHVLMVTENQAVYVLYFLRCKVHPNKTSAVWQYLGVLGVLRASENLGHQRNSTHFVCAIGSCKDRVSHKGLRRPGLLDRFDAEDGNMGSTRKLDLHIGMPNRSQLKGNDLLRSGGRNSLSLFSGGSFDGSLREFKMDWTPPHDAHVLFGPIKEGHPFEKRDNVQSNEGKYLKGHSDVVTCMALAEDGQHVVTGSADCCVVIWAATAEHQWILDNILLGHDDVVLSVAVSSSLDLVCSVSLDGTCIMHTLEHGVYIRSIAIEEDHGLTNTSRNLENSNLWVGLALHHLPCVIVWNEKKLELIFFSVNGRKLGICKPTASCIKFCFTNNHEFLVCATRQNTVIIARIRTMQVLCVSRPLRSSISSMVCLHSSSSAIRMLFALNDGSFSLLIAD